MVTGRARRSPSGAGRRCRSSPSTWRSSARRMVGVTQRGHLRARVPGRRATSPAAARPAPRRRWAIAQGAKYNAAKIDEHQRDHSLYMAFAPGRGPEDRPGDDRGERRLRRRGGRADRAPRVRLLPAGPVPQRGRHGAGARGQGRHPGGQAAPGIRSGLAAAGRPPVAALPPAAPARRPRSRRHRPRAPCRIATAAVRSRGHGAAPAPARCRCWASAGPSAGSAARRPAAPVAASQRRRHGHRTGRSGHSAGTVGVMPAACSSQALTASGIASAMRRERAPAGKADVAAVRRLP